MNGFFNVIKSFAVKNWQKYPYRREWAAVIVLLLILKLSTSLVSMFSGYYYLENFFFSFTNSTPVARCFSIVALLIIEGLCAMFLAKFFKFALRLDFKTAVFPLICVGLVFWCSFIVSTNGIALYANKAEDLSKEITAKYNALSENAKTQCAADIQTNEDYISTLKSNPQGWSGGRRCMLSDFQTQEVAKAYDAIEGRKKALSVQLKEIEAQCAAALEENNKKTIDTSERYYNIVAIIMLVQILCSGGLWFFWCKIAAEDAPEVDRRESIQDVYDKAGQLIDSGVNTAINDRLSVVTDAFNMLAAKYNGNKTAIPDATMTPKRQAGFAVAEAREMASENAVLPTKTETPPDTPTDAVSAVNAAVKTPPVNGVSTCLHCGKPLTQPQMYRRAKYCCDSCRVKAYNARNPKSKQIVIAESSLS